MEIPVFNANTVDPDQTPGTVAADLGLHCLQITILYHFTVLYIDEKGRPWSNYADAKAHPYLYCSYIA